MGIACGCHDALFTPSLEHVHGPFLSSVTLTLLKSTAELCHIWGLFQVSPRLDPHSAALMQRSMGNTHLSGHPMQSQVVLPVLTANGQCFQFPHCVIAPSPQVSNTQSVKVALEDPGGSFPVGWPSMGGFCLIRPPPA